MFCPACGTNNESGSRFCYKCGRELSDGTATPRSGPAWREFAEPPEPEPLPPPPEPVPEPLPPPPPQPAPLPPKRDPLPLIAAVPAAVGLIGVFMPWVSAADVNGAGTEFGAGKAGLALALLAGGGMVYAYFKPEVKLGLWLALATYVIFTLIGAVAVLDPGRLAGDELNGLLAAADLGGVAAEWGAYLVLLAGLAGTGISAWVGFRTKGFALGEAGLEGILDRAASAASSLSSMPTSLSDLASRTISQPNDAASMATSMADTISRTISGQPQAPAGTAGDVATGASQIVIGAPKKRSPVTPLIIVLVLLGVLGAGAYGAYYASQHVNVDRASLPIIGNKVPDAPILVSLTRTCADSAGQACNLVWDVTAVTPQADGLRIQYEVRVDGQSNCKVALEADNAIAARLDSEGKPGPFLEGGRGRYYPLVRSEGFTQSGSNLDCGAKQSGVWIFASTAGETSVKLRYPDLPPAQIELSPVAIRLLPPADPLSVIPVQATTCVTSQDQPCRGTWEIGPYGLARDGSTVVFYAIRFEGPANCQVNWISDLQAHKDLLSKGEGGIRLEKPGGGGRSALTGAGGLSTRDGLLPCGSILRGYWRFAAGDLGQTVDLIYPDFNLVKLPIRP